MKNQKKNNKKKTTKKTENRKTTTIVLIAAAVVVVAVLAGFGIRALLSDKGQTETIEQAELGPVYDGVKDMLDGDASAADAEAAGDETEDGEPASDEADGEDGEAADDSGLIGYTGDLFDNDRQGIVPSGVGGESIEVEIPTISFPYAIAGTDLVVEQISPYSGYFIEDGSDEDVSNIAAIVLTNNGGDLDFVGIGIAQGSRSLAFSASQIPAGSSVIIQEQNRAAYADGDFYSCTATTTESSGFDLMADSVRIEDNKDDTFTIANITDETIPEVTVYFKNYLPDENVYVGGVTYHVTLTDIEPETGVVVTSSHYATGYSDIVEIVPAE